MDQLTAILTETRGQHPTPVWCAPRTGSSPIGFMKQAWTIAKYFVLRRKQFTVVHTFNPSSWISFLSLFLGRILGKKTVTEITLIGSDDPRTFLKHKNILGVLGLLLAQRINSLSPALKDVVESYKLLAPKSVNVPRSVLIPEISTKNNLSKTDFDKAAFRFIFAGAFMTRKGSDIIVQFLPELLERYPNSTITFLLGIPAKDEDNSDLKTLETMQAERPRQIIIHQNAQDMDSQYQNSDFLFLPSRREGLPNVVLESMSYQIIPILNLIEGITDSIVDSGVDGKLIQDNKPSEYINAVETCTLDFETFERMGQAARKKIISKYDRKHIMLQYGEVYGS